MALTLMEGNEAVARGAVAAGCRFFAGYPITPATTILNHMLALLPPLGGVCIQGEDEIASIGFCLGASMAGMKVMTSSEVTNVDTKGKVCKVTIKTKKGEEVVEADVVLSAVGIATNVEGIGLEECGIRVEGGKVVVDDYYRTNVEGYYAIGDIVRGPALAHVASHEGITCVEKIAGLDPEPMDYGNIPNIAYLRS